MQKNLCTFCVEGVFLDIIGTKILSILSYTNSAKIMRKNPGKCLELCRDSRMA